jgi:hypothetical protein
VRFLAMASLAWLLLACPAAQTKVSPEGRAAVSDPAAPRTVTLVQDQSVELAPGVQATLKSVLYTHATDRAGRSVNDALMELDVTHGGKTERVTLQRLFPDGPQYLSVAGLRLAIDFVDAYHQPSTGAMLVLPASPP